MNTLIEQPLDEVISCLRLVSGQSLIQASAMVEDAHRIFVCGAGRSGLIMQAFGIRLMHLGKDANVVGLPTTPSIQAEDLLIIGSGSGQTSTLMVIAQKARSLDAKILLFTTDANSGLADISGHRVVIPAPSLKDTKSEQHLKSVQPMGTLFEQSLLILCDSLVLALMSRLGVSSAQMRERHANLE